MKAHHGHSLRTRRRWLVGLALVAIVVLHATLMVRLFLSPEQFRLRTQAVLREHWPGAVSVGEAAYRFPAGFRLREIGLDRSAKRGGDRLFQAKALALTCSFLSALRGEVAVAEVVVEQPELFVQAEDLRAMRGRKGPGPRPEVGRVVLRNGRVVLGEGVLFEGSPAQELRALSVDLREARRLESGFTLEGEAESDLWGRCSLHGTVDLKEKRFDAEIVARRVEIGPRLRELLPPKAVAALDRYHFQGAVDLTVEPSIAWGGESLELDLAATAELLDCTARWEKFPIPCTDIRGQVAYDGTNVYYRNIRGRAGEATITLEGSTTEDKVEIDFRARGRPLNQALYEAAHPPLKRLWDRCGIQGGVVDVHSHSVWHRAERRFEATVTTNLRDGQGTYKTFPYPLTDATGVFVWRGTGTKKLTDSRVPGVTQIRSLKARHGDARVEITGESTDDGIVDLTIRASDVPLDDALRRALQPRWRKVYDQFRPTGRVAAEVRISGPTKKPQVPEYRIAIRPQGAAFRHVKFPHTVENVRGEIRIDEKGRVTLHDLTGNLGDIPLKFLGSVTPGPQGPVSDITVRAPEVTLGPSVQRLLTEGWRAAYQQLDPRGTVAFTWKLTEDPAADVLRQTSEIECLRNCSIQHQQFPVRITGLLGRLHVDGTGHALFTGMKGRIGDAVVEAVGGEYVPGEGGGLRFTLQASGLEFSEELRRALPESWQAVWRELQPTGEADVEYQFAANPPDGSTPRQRVSIEPRDVTVTCPKFPLPCTDIARGKVTFDQDGNATISDLQGKVREKTVVITGKVTRSEEQAPIHLEVSARKLPLDAKLRKALPEEWQEAWDTFQPRGAADLDVAVDGDLRAGRWSLTSLSAALDGCQATYARLPVPLTGLRGRIEFEDGTVTLTDLIGRSPLADQVRLEGRVSTDGAADTRLQLRAQNLRIAAQLLKAVPDRIGAPLSESELSGAADLDVTVTLPAGADGPAAAFFGQADLRRCSFRRGHPVQQLDGEVQVERGTVGADRGLELAGTLNLRTLTARQLTATGVQGQFAYALQPPAKDEKPHGPPLLTLTGLQGSFYGGRLSVPKAEIDLRSGAIRSTSTLLSDVDLKEFAREGLRYKKPLTGVLDLKIEVPPGTLKKPEGLVGDGTARVEHGELGNLPVAAAVFDVLSLKLPERSITKGEMTFGMGAEKLHIDRISLGREGWLMNGWGTVGYDQSLALKFVTPRSGSVLDLPRLVVGSLVEVDIGGTLNEPETGQTIVPVTRAYDEFKRVLKFW